MVADRKLRWHPRSKNKFAVAGAAQITLYEWDTDESQIRHLSSLNELNHMKCFAWSPDKACDDLVAIGNTTGSVELTRLDATRDGGSVLCARAPIAEFAVRNHRACNALAFCESDSNYLAAGMDKVRGDCSLLVFDIHTATPALSLHLPTPSPVPTPRPVPHLQRLEPLPRGTDPHVLQQHAPTDIVSTLLFAPHTTSQLLAGISHRWLRIFDLRNPNNVRNVATKVSHIAADPFDAHRIGCSGDGVVNIWDIRMMTLPLLTFTEKDAAADGARYNPRASICGLEFSREKRGMLAVMQKDATHVRFWDIQQTQPPRETQREAARRSPRETPQGTRRGSWFGTAQPANENTHFMPSQQNIVLADTRKTKNFARPLASFALVPSSKKHPLTCNVMVVNKEGDLELYAVHDTPKHAVWSARGDLAIGAGSACRVIPGFTETEPPPEPWEIPETNTLPVVPIASTESRSGSVPRGRPQQTGRPTFGRGDEDGFPALLPPINKVTANLAATRPGAARNYSPSSIRNYPFEHGGDRRRASSPPKQPLSEASRGRSRHFHHSKSLSRRPSLTAVNQLVAEDISMVMRHRVIRGYSLMQPQHNCNITRESVDSTDNQDTRLSELWAWMKHSNDLLTLPTGRLYGFNFAHQGLLGIWEGFDHSPLPSERAPSPPPPTKSSGRKGGRRTPLPPDEFHGDFHAAVVQLAARRGAEKSWRPPVLTNKLVYRQLALQICGWSLKDDDLNVVVHRWEKEGKFSRAACWLVFTRQHGKAVDLLMRTKDEALHLISGTVTALTPHSGTENSTRNVQLRQHCERLIVRLQDPYLRAMLTYLTTADWTEVLDDEALPSRERLAIAFIFLNDKALSSYLRRTADSMCARGDIEGLLITGLTRMGMDIVQTYVDRTGDVQTAAILSSYVCPARFKDRRADRWLEAYRDLLDGFRLFHHRVAFDTERGKILQDAIGHGEMESTYEWAPRQIMLRCNYCNKTVNVPPPATTGEAVPATSCPHCGRALPRCSVCLMSLAVVHDAQREHELSHSRVRADTFDDAIVLCQTCRHGGHASHILEWFFGEDGSRSHRTCPVADCDCNCADQL